MNSLEAAMRVLKLLDKRRPVLRVGEISRALSLQKSTVSRLLRTLSEHEFLEREKEGPGYTVGRRSLVLSDLYLAAHSLLDRVDATIDVLVEEFGFVGYAGVLSGADIVVLRLKSGRYPLRFVQDVGQRVPAERTAIGRALLARQPDKARGNRAALVEELAKIRRDGWAAIESAIIPVSLRSVPLSATRCAARHWASPCPFRPPLPTTCCARAWHEEYATRRSPSASALAIRSGPNSPRLANGARAKPSGRLPER
jgi:DNA-binding IclR family transcriptional regulator